MKKLPHFDTLKELIDFLDNNDLSEYYDSMPEVEFEVSLKSKLMPKAMLDQIMLDDIRDAFLYGILHDRVPMNTKLRKKEKDALAEYPGTNKNPKEQERTTASAVPVGGYMAEARCIAAAVLAIAAVRYTHKAAHDPISYVLSIYREYLRAITPAEGVHDVEKYYEEEVE